MFNNIIMRNYAKCYFRTLIKWLSNGNLKPGDTLRMGMIFYDKNGKPSDVKEIVEIHKDEL